MNEKLQSEIDAITSAGSIIVVASGNDHTSDRQFFPTNCNRNIIKIYYINGGLERVSPSVIPEVIDIPILKQKDNKGKYEIIHPTTIETVIF